MIRWMRLPLLAGILGLSSLGSNPAVSAPSISAPGKMAELVWNMRAALNVAALQCQFDPSLKLVERYNEFLKVHADELNQARLMLVRQRGGEAAFDRYNTKTYNGFSAFENQVPFCQKASEVSEKAMSMTSGQLASLAIVAMPEITAFFPRSTQVATRQPAVKARKKKKYNS